MPSFAYFGTWKPTRHINSSVKTFVNNIIVKRGFSLLSLYTCPGGGGGGLEQVWACISSLHLYCNYLEIIKAQFLIGQDFIGFEIIKKI